MFAWLAVFVLLSNAVLPTVLVIGLAGQSPGRGDLRLDLCSTSPGGDAPGKAKPGLLLHHCALCIAAFVEAIPRSTTAGSGSERGASQPP